MRHPSSLLLLAILSALVAVPARAQTPPGGGGPAADYTAEFKIQNYGPKLRGRVYGAPGKERRETPDPWGGTTLILRYDLGVAWTVYPGGGAYAEHPLRQAGTSAPPPGSPPQGLMPIENDGINDVPATKYAFPATATGPGGFIWLSPQGIALRIDARPRPGEPEVRFELDNLRLEPQNPALFELPPGARRVNPPASAGAAPPR